MSSPIVSERVISSGEVIQEGGQSYRVIDDKPVSGSETIKAPPASPAPMTNKTSLRLPADAGLLVVELPRTGKVFINGAETSATGSVRRYVSRGLKAGEKYDFTVRMVVDQDGRPTEHVRVVALSAGEKRTVSFESVATKSRAARTSLTLRVPADAKVWLAGQETTSSGEIRRFETAVLGAGDRWAGYEIRVATIADGKERVSRKVIELTGGDSLDLAVGVDDVKAAEQSADAGSAPVADVASIR